MPNTEHLFVREEVYPSWYPNALGYFTSLHAAGFVISKLDATHIEVVAGAGDAAAVIAIEGSWRWVESTVTRAHPGGSAGTYDIYVTGTATDIVSSPAPFTDDTTYSWALWIGTAGSTPTIVTGVVDIYRKVGSLQWDGAQITRIDQTVPAIGPHAHTHSSAGTDPIAPADIGAATETDLLAEVTRAEGVEATLVPTGSAATLSTLHLTGAGTALTVDNNELISGTSTIGGLLTAKSGATLDAATGTAGQTLTLTGRNAGVGVSSTLAVSSTGALTLTSGTSTLTGASSGGTVWTATTTAFNIPSGSQYQVGGTQISLSNLSNSTTGTGTTVVMSASPTITGTLTVAAVNASGAYTQTGAGANTFSGATTFSATGTAVTVTNTLSVGTVAATTFSGTPSFSGAVTGQTAAPGDNTLKLATTAFVTAAVAVGGASPATATPLMDGTGAVGTSLLYARQDHVHPSDTSRATLTTNTFTGLQTLQAGMTLDAGSGTAGQTITMTGRSSGAAASATLAVSSVGSLTGNVPTGQTVTWQVNATTVWSLSSTGIAITGTLSATGLVTANAGFTLDAGSGTAGQTLTLTGRASGAGVSSTVAVSSAGALTITSGTSSLVGATSGGTAFTASTSAFNVASGVAYQINGTTVIPSGATGSTGTGNVVLSAGPTLTGTTTIATAAVTTFSGTPNFTGAVTGQTAPANDNSAKLATTQWVQQNLVSAPFLVFEPYS